VSQRPGSGQVDETYAAASRDGGFEVAAPEGPDSDPGQTTAQHFRLAAILFIGGGLGAAPADALHRPAFGPEIYLLPLLAIVSGAFCWIFASRIPRWALHVLAVVATIEIAVTVAIAGPVFSVYYIFIAIFVAYVFRDRRVIAAHVAFACAAVLAPIFYEPELARDHLIQAVVLTPSLILTAGAVAFLRERLAASELRYRHLSERDPLTGVGNYRMLTSRTPLEFERHRRHKRPLALLSIDLDNFKSVNDSYGHQRGDRVLQEVAIALAGTVRASDFVVRQGGDEFAVVAVETDLAAAQELAGRLSNAVGAIVVGGAPMRISIGLATFPEDGTGLERLLATADVRLREIKETKPEHRSRTMSLFASDS
jgi:diguanylate cyclase (GGDEF)-like protein